MKFRQHRLDNGLNVVAECSDQAYSTALAFFVRAGSRDESEELSGVSHFLEHMVFKGTPTRSAADVNRELDELGSHSNAFTSEEQTVYYATVLPEYQTAIVELLADVMRPSLRIDDFESEKKVIIEEILKYEDQPPFGAHEKCMEAYFGDHPLAKNVLGTVESIQAMTAENMRGYFEQRYSPGNITLVACGNVAFDELVSEAQRLCGDWQPFDARRKVAPAVARLGERRFEKESTAQAYTVQISSGPSATDPLRFAARLLSYMIGDDSGSRMYWSLVDPGIAEYAGASSYEFDGAGIVMSYMCCAPEDVDLVLSQVADIQADLDRGGVTEDELELVKSKVCSQLVRRSERPSNRLFSVGNSWLQRQSYRSMRETIEAYRQVSMQDIAEVLTRYPLTETMTVAIGPSPKMATA